MNVFILASTQAEAGAAMGLGVMVVVTYLVLWLRERFDKDDS